MLIWAVAAGLLLLAGGTFLLVWGLESQVMNEALDAETEQLERHFREVIDRYARDYLGVEGGSLEKFGERLRTAAEANPAVLDLTVVTPTRVLVSRFSRGSDRNSPCLARLPLGRRVSHEHPPGSLNASRLGCMVLPVYVGDQHRGAVLVHTMRDWLREGARAGRTVERTALRLAPVFLGFYLLLGAMLIVAGRAARRWRIRAAVAERVEALGAIADGINHEIRNPLNAVSLSLQLLARRQTDEETARVLKEAQRQTRRIGDTIEEFVRFTRVSRLKTVAVDIGPLVKAVAGATVEVRGSAAAQVDDAKLRDALVAMFSHVGPPVTVRLDQTRESWRISVSGESEGLDPKAVERLFEPYLRSRRNDVGRGLALARAVFQAHGGGLSAHLKGTRLTIRGHAPRAQPGEKT